MGSKVSRLGLVGGGAVLLFGFALGFSGMLPIPEVSVEWRSRAGGENEYRPALSVTPGTELVLVAVLSSRCYWSNLPEVREAVRTAKMRLAERAEREGLTFMALGVARDMSAEAGIEHLRAHGAFDEVIAGRGWFNSGVMKFIYGDFEGPGATPQLVVLEQKVSTEAGPSRISGRRVLARRTGSDAILQWVGEGAPFTR